MTDMRDEFDASDVELNLDPTPVTDSDDELALDLDLATPAAEDDQETGLNFDFVGSVEGAAEDLELNLGEDSPAPADAAPAADTPDETAPEAEAALAELRERLSSEPGEWYVIHTYSGMENRVKQNLESRVKTLNQEDYIFEAVVPTEQVEEIRGNQKKLVTRSVLPGYVLVRMELTNESWATVRHTPSVTGFVGQTQAQQDPVPISLTEVEELLAPAVMAAATQASTGKPAKRKIEVADYTVGDSVQVDDGAFAGVHATVTEINPHNQRVKVLVEILGRETPIDLTFAQIKKI